MAKIPKSIYYDIQPRAYLTRGSLIYHSAPRKGFIAKIARFIGRVSKIERFRYWGYEAMPTIREDEFKHPIGIAIDEKTILISGGFSIPNEAFGEPQSSSVSHANLMQELRNRDK